MPRATICVRTDDPAEVTAVENWLAQWKDQLSYLSDNYGCGCCVELYDVEGPTEAIGSLPPEVVCESDWGRTGTPIH